MKIIKLFLITCVFVLSGCGTSTFSLPLSRTPLDLSPPPKLHLQTVKFVVIHKDNAEAIFKQLESEGLQPVVFALTGADYKALAVNIGSVKDHILLQRQIIILYKSYYEGE